MSDYGEAHPDAFVFGPPATVERAVDPEAQRRAAVAAGVEAQERVDANADDDWKVRADRAIRECAEMFDRFDADDVWDRGLDVTRENRALGPRLTAAARAGLIEGTAEYRRSRQVQCHGMPRRVWRSLIRRPE